MGYYCDGCYAIHSFLLQVLGAGGELFPTNVMLVSVSWLQNRATTLAMITNWSVSYVGNFIGCLITAR